MNTSLVAGGQRGPLAGVSRQLQTPCPEGVAQPPAHPQCQAGGVDRPHKSPTYEAPRRRRMLRPFAPHVPSMTLQLAAALGWIWHGSSRQGRSLMRCTCTSGHRIVSAATVIRASPWRTGLAALCTGHSGDRRDSPMQASDWPGVHSPERVIANVSYARVRTTFNAPVSAARPNTS